jgi:hypothetical protein
MNLSLKRLLLINFRLDELDELFLVALDKL